MTARVLTILSAGYRATVEEQDDTVLWLTAMCAAGLEIDVVLTGSSVFYGIESAQPATLTIAGGRAAQPPNVAEQVADLLERGVSVSYLEDDTAAYGIDPNSILDQIKPIRRQDLTVVVTAHDHVWRF